jgi:hypothetical protein
MFNREELDRLNSMAKQYQNHVETVMQIMLPVLKQAEEHQKLLTQNITRAIDIPDLSNIIIPKVNLPNFSDILLDYQKQIQPAIQIALHQSQIVQQVLSSFKSDYFDQINRISDVFSKIIVPSDSLKTIVQAWKHWDKSVENKVFEICKKYHYFISPSTPKEFRNYLFIAYDKKSTKKTVEEEFYKIYKKDNWKALNFYKAWKHNNYLEKRRLVIKDVVSYIKNNKKPPSPRIVLPAIISQINGILVDIALDNGISMKEVTKNKLEKSKTEKKIREEIITLLKSNSTEIQSEIAFNMIESVLFQDVWTGKSPKRGTYNFSRHKIMHGEETRGLTKANMIRAFLLLDFLSQFLQKQM